MRKDFYHQLLQPYRALAQRAVRSDLVGSGGSDIAASANALAIAAAHFAEAKKLPLQPNEQRVQSILQDVADSAKHGGPLRKPERTVSLSVSLAYEFNDQGGVRFLRTEVTASNQRVGSFDLIETLRFYIQSLNERLHLGFPPIEASLSTDPFGSAAISNITANTAEVGSVSIRTYKRDASGMLVLADPPSLLFTVNGE